LLSYRNASITRSIAGRLRFFTFTQCSDMHRLVDVGLLQSEIIELSRARLVANSSPCYDSLQAAVWGSPAHDPLTLLP
jgi:hypothetical protein